MSLAPTLHAAFDAFDAAAQQWGWSADQGSAGAAKRDYDNYRITRTALVAAITEALEEAKRDGAIYEQSKRRRQKDDIARLARAGLSSGKIAQHTGCSRNAVISALRMMGVPLARSRKKSP